MAVRCYSNICKQIWSNLAFVKFEKMGKYYLYPVWGLCSVKNVIKLYKLRNAGDWLKVKSIFCFISLGGCKLITKSCWAIIRHTPRYNQDFLLSNYRRKIFRWVPLFKEGIIIVSCQPNEVHVKIADGQMRWELYLVHGNTFNQ